MRTEMQEAITTLACAWPTVVEYLRREQARIEACELVSLDGWTCDTCGLPVNGQTDDLGIPLVEGDSVRHILPEVFAAARIITKAQSDLRRFSDNTIKEGSNT